MYVTPFIASVLPDDSGRYFFKEIGSNNFYLLDLIVSSIDNLPKKILINPCYGGEYLPGSMIPRIEQLYCFKSGCVGSAFEAGIVTDRTVFCIQHDLVEDGCANGAGQGTLLEATRFTPRWPLGGGRRGFFINCECSDCRTGFSAFINHFVSLLVQGESVIVRVKNLPDVWSGLLKAGSGNDLLLKRLVQTRDAASWENHESQCWEMQYE